jgi:hypothetical protein
LVLGWLALLLVLLQRERVRIVAVRDQPTKFKSDIEGTVVARMSADAGDHSSYDISHREAQPLVPLSSTYPRINRVKAVSLEASSPHLHLRKSAINGLIRLI